MADTESKDRELTLGEIYEGSSPEALIYVLGQHLGTLEGYRRASVVASLRALVRDEPSNDEAMGRFRLEYGLEFTLF